MNSEYSESFAKESRKAHPKQEEEKSARSEGAFWFFSLLCHSVSHRGPAYTKETADEQLIAAAQALQDLHTEVCKGFFGVLLPDEEPRGAREKHRSPWRR